MSLSWRGDTSASGGIVAGGNAPAGAIRAVRRATGLGVGAGAGWATAGTMVIGGGAAAAFVARGAAGFFLATASPVARRGAATAAKALGSSGTGKSGVFGGAARRGKDSDPNAGDCPF